MLAALFGAFGWALGGPQTASVFVFCALLAALAVYAYGDRALLGMLGAREYALAEDPLLRSTVDTLAAKLDVARPRLYLIPDGYPRALAAGAAASSVVPEYRLDPSVHTGQFVIVTNAKRVVLASGIELAGATPLPPENAFVAASERSPRLFTWRLKDDLPVAAAVAAFRSFSGEGYVIVGRSLAEHQRRAASDVWLAGAALAGWTAIASLWLFNPSGGTGQKKPPFRKAA